MEAKWVPKSMKNHRLGLVLEVLAAPWASRKASADKAAPKRRPKCSQDGPRCSQRGQLERTWGPSWRQDGGMMANLPPRWHQKAIKKRFGIERFFRQVLGGILKRYWEPRLKKNRSKTTPKPFKICLEDEVAKT